MYDEGMFIYGICLFYIRLEAQKMKVNIQINESERCEIM